MLITLSTCLLYLATYAFYQAGKRRTVFAGLKASSPKRQFVRGAGWGFAAAALIVLSLSNGWERGIPIWLAAFMLAAFTCLLIGSLLPKRHFISAIAFAGFGIILSIIYLAGGPS